MPVDWDALDALAQSDGAGYDRFGDLPALAALERRVSAAESLAEFTVTELRAVAFFGARRRRWNGGWPPPSPDEEALALRIVRELTRRMGPAWVRARMHPRGGSTA